MADRSNTETSAPREVVDVLSDEFAKELTRLLFPAAAIAWDLDIEYGLEKGWTRAVAISKAYRAHSHYRSESNYPAARDQVRAALRQAASKVRADD